MTPTRKSALLLGVSNPLGVAVARHLVLEKQTDICMADLTEHAGFIEGFAKELGLDPRESTAPTMHPTRPLLGLPKERIERLAETVRTVFLLGLVRDRRLKASQIRQHNVSLLKGAFDLAHSLKGLESMVVATDVGLIGDYPGRFYESWLDVGQVPFDAVDRSSFETESACLKETSLPIVRARIGILSDLERPTVQNRCWRTAAQILLPSLKLLRRLPRFVTIPSAVSKNCLAPLTPTEWAARAVTALSENTGAAGKAFHLVVEDAPPMNRVLETIGKMAGGATIKGGLQVKAVEALGAIPGLRETARRQADHVAAWWTPHRYCLSRNELDTKQLQRLVNLSEKEVFTTPSIQQLFRLV